MPAVVRVNGESFSPESAHIGATDHGFLYGNGLFETMRAVDGRAFLLERHLTRIRAGAEAIVMPMPEYEELVHEVEAAVADSGETDAYVRLTITRGVGAMGPDPTSCGAPTVMVAVKPFPEAPERWFTQGMKVALSGIRRSTHSPLPRLKSLNYMECILAKQTAKAAGADDAVLLDTDGNITEATAWNVFFVEDGRLHTPSERCPLLPGITRGFVLGLAEGAGIVCRDGEYTPLRLSMATEAFLTNSLYGIVPIGSFDGAALGDDVPGVITSELWRRYEMARVDGSLI